jgi:hydrogenase maturation protease
MKVRVIGVGNLLLGDEGVGVHAIRELERAPLPPGVELVDGGTAGLGLLGFLDDADAVIFIDAAELKSPPGSFRRFRTEQVRDLCQDRELSLHETGLLNVLALARATGTWPREVILFGVQPASLAPSMELSPACAGRLGELAAEIRAEIDRLTAEGYH